MSEIYQWWVDSDRVTHLDERNTQEDCDNITTPILVEYYPRDTRQLQVSVFYEADGSICSTHVATIWKDTFNIGTSMIGPEILPLYFEALAISRTIAETMWEKWT